jgi:molybdopterin converting factor small subunit
MILYLKAGGKLREKLKPNIDNYTREIEIEKKLSLKEILEQLEIPRELIAFAIVDGQLKRFDYHPKDGQTITLLPPVAGG